MDAGTGPFRDARCLSTAIVFRAAGMLGMAFLSGISDTISSNPLAWKRLTAFTGYMNLAHPKTVMIGVGPLSIAEVVAVSRYHAPVALSPDAREAIAASRSVIDDLAHDVRPHYGVSTGFGALATKHIAPDQRVQLQRSLVRSHAASSGAEVGEPCSCASRPWRPAARVYAQ